MSLFQGIDQFRGQLSALNIQVVFRKDGQLHVSVTPVVAEKSGETNPHLTKPFALSATAAELDADFVSALAPVASTRASLVDQAKREAEEMKAAAAAKKTPSKAATTKAATPKPSGSVSFDDEADAEGEGEDAKDTTPATNASAPAPAAAPVAQSTDTLFD